MAHTFGIFLKHGATRGNASPIAVAGLEMHLTLKDEYPHP
jgi:hypothetical protein